MRGILRSFALALVAGAFVALTGIAGAGAKDTIKLGFIGPLTGGNALQGLGARNGFELAIRQANESDYPYQVEGVALDDASDPAVGVSAALKLVNDPQVVGAIGHWNSPVALATIHIFHSHRIPFIVWGAISPRITEFNYPMVTRVTPTLIAENKPLVGFLVNELGFKRFSVISDTSDYGRDNSVAFAQFVQEQGGEILSNDAVPVGTTDFRPILTKVQGLAPDAVYFGGVITEAGLVRKQMHEMGLKLPFTGISGIYDEKFIEIAGAGAAEGTVVDVPGVKETPAYKAFVEAYEQANFSDPAGPYGKYAYDAANILLTAIKAVGPEDKTKIAEHIRSIEYDGALGRTSFDEKGQTKLDVTVSFAVVQDGKWTPWEESEYASGKRKLGGM